MAKPQTSLAEPVSDGQHAQWIAGRVTTLLSHYYQPDAPAELREAAIDDWIKLLLPFPPQTIEKACASYLRDQPRRRPSPGDICARCNKPKRDDQTAKPRGDRSALSYDGRQLLEEKVLPTAKRWLRDPALRQSGKSTLEFWGEPYSQEDF